ncbi:MAG: hypothetical protein HOW73_18200 [Polyangiaceae bacterium]|nr:hypothetical protein [Polyangiaceae bacterium]
MGTMNRIQLILVWVLGFAWFSKPDASFDRRRRTTLALAEFSRYANRLAFAALAYRLSVYGGYSNELLHFVPDDSTWTALLTGPGTNALELKTVLMFAKDWGGQAAAIFTLRAIHRRLVRIAEADHG